MATPSNEQRPTVCVGDRPTADEYRAHLRQLSPESCRHRFQHAVSPSGIEAATDQAKKAELIGLRLGQSLIGVAELHAIGSNVAEMAISINEPFRGRGHGKRLFHAALEHAHTLAIKRVCFLCGTGNLPMRRLLARKRAQQMQEGKEIAAWIDLPLTGKR